MYFISRYQANEIGKAPGPKKKKNQRSQEDPILPKIEEWGRQKRQRGHIKRKQENTTLRTGKIPLKKKADDPKDTIYNQRILGGRKGALTIRKTKSLIRDLLEGSTRKRPPPINKGGGIW